MNIEQRKELALAGHALAKKMNAGGDAPFIEVAKLVADLSTQLDVTTAALREKTKQSAALAADAISSALGSCSEFYETDCVMEANGITYQDAELRALGALALHHALMSLARQLRQEAV